MQGNDLTLYGVTANGYVIYYDHAAATIDAVSLAGGTPSVIASAPGANFDIQSQNDAVLVWTNLDANQVGSLVIWTAADGAHTVSSASQDGYGLVDSSSRYAVYITNTNETASTCDIDGSLTDGTEVARLVLGVPEAPDLAFVIAGSYAVLNYESTTGATIASYVLGTWATTVLSAPAPSFSYVLDDDAAGTEILVLNAANELQVVPIGGGAGTTIGAAPAAGTVTQGSTALFTSDGSTVLFTGAGATTLDRSPVVTPATTVLATATDLSLYALSPTDHTLLAFSGTPSNLVFGSATADGTLTTVAAATDLGGALYTPDSSHILVLSGVDSTTFIGSLSAFTVSSRSSAVVDGAVESVATFGTAEAVFSNNVTTNTVDVNYVNTSSTAASKRIVAGAHPSFLLTPETTTRLVYSWSVDLGATAGIYVTSLP